jgi:hypothetical protein
MKDIKSFDEIVNEQNYKRMPGTYNPGTGLEIMELDEVGELKKLYLELEKRVRALEQR